MRVLFQLLIFGAIVLQAPVATAQHASRYDSRYFQFLVYSSGDVRFDDADSLAKYEDHERSVDSIVVLRKKTNTRIQVIVPEENSYDYNSVAGNDPLTIEDMNFDGYADIRIRQFLPAGPNVPYFCWVYDARHQKFIRNRRLEDITSAVFDPKSKTIVSDWRSSAGSYGSSTYKYMAGRLMLVREVTKTSAEDNGDMITVTKVLTDGKMKVTSRTRSKNWD